VLSEKMTHSRMAPAMFRPEFYPRRSEHVKFIQAHVSYIFIAGDYVYKIKKAVYFDFLDNFCLSS
jgi:aminoglycoside phosphotransferase family enzyme